MNTVKISNNLNKLRNINISETASTSKMLSNPIISEVGFFHMLLSNTNHF